ncbi:MAG: twin-arginine translocation pathway signal protein, partial [Flavobacteriaceae bacterium]
MEKNIQNISRRSFVKGIGLASGGLILACNSNIFPEDKNPIRGDFTSFTPNVFIQLDSDGLVTLIASRSEMGNGVRTSITSIIADEMEADWSKVIIKQGTGDSKYGDQNTDGSRSVRYLFTTMRKLGASTKAILIAAAAQQWEVPVVECHAEKHFIHHSSGKKIGFGALVDIAKTIEIPENAPLKATKDFKYIGKHLPSVDAKDYVSGRAIFGLDFRIPNMKFAAMRRCPSTFGSVQSVNKIKASAIKGVETIIEIPRVATAFGTLGGVAVIASNTWAAFKGKDALEIVWDMGKNGNYNSKTYMDSLTKNVHKQGKVAKDRGSIQKAFEESVQTIESTFQLPHLAHTPMEVPNATAWVQGDTCEVWAPIQ